MNDIRRIEIYKEQRAARIACLYRVERTCQNGESELIRLQSAVNASRQADLEGEEASGSEGLIEFIEKRTVRQSDRRGEAASRSA